MANVQRRCDGHLSTAKLLPNGSYRIPATLTRVGVLQYRRDDGSIQRELRHPDEVFAADSLETLAAVPLTIRHPTEMVSPQNHRALSVGHVGDNVRRDSDHVAADVVVTTEDAIEQVADGRLTEISCGYRCDFDPTPGEWEGEPYDGVQRDIRYNHAALLPAGHGRAGRTVGLRLDADGHEIAAEAPTATDGRDQEQPPHAEAEKPKCGQAANGALSMTVIRIDGVDYDPATHGSGLGQAVARLQARLDASEQATADARATADKAAAEAEAIANRTDEAHKAEVEALTAEKEAAEAKAEAADAAKTEATVRADSLQKKLDEATSPAAIDAAVTERFTLIEQARAITGDPEFRADGMTPGELRRSVLAILHGHEEIDTAEQAYVDAAFAYLAKHKAEGTRSDAKDGAGKTTAGVPPVTAPAPLKSDRRDSKLLNRLKPVTAAWQQPLNGD